jgi:hypothetical protein
MNPWLIGAAALSVLIAPAHSVIGEQRIFRHLRRAGGIVPTEGGTLLRTPISGCACRVAGQLSGCAIAPPDGYGFPHDS